MSMIENFEQMLAQGQDNALLRFGLGQAYLKEGQAEQAVDHLRKALEHDPAYSAAWKLLGQALTDAGRRPDAIKTYEQGIRNAEHKGDMQAAKEMKVFLKRLQKQDG
jgi:Tfp pilus assembly protein PilF